MASSSEIFGSDVFDLNTMQSKLPKATFKALRNAIEQGSRLDLSHADVIAHSMMEWAISKGCTHYTHWFQPMTGLTAQKHDAFLTMDKDLRPFEQFSGNQLVQGEPDASSFPSGGMRSTFEARGYTAWDPSSPVFVMSNGNVPFLCIPSVFFSYTGHALDKKTPLMRSMKALDRAASEALRLINAHREVKVQATVGCEQEYFLVDRKLYEKRPDLIMAGRTLLGCRPAKGQQMEDHYFGAIKSRVLEFMHDLETRLYRLGVPCKTRHNEVAPHQYETAPIFETANLAADHNQVAMEMIKQVAADHGLAAVLHEKPFADVNGSGKHVNWSMSASDGANLLEPGREPHRNLTFLYFLVAVVNAIHKRGAVLRSTIATPGNDHRLGANEAPPAIMSVFLGSHVSEILDTIETASEFNQQLVESIDLGLSELPELRRDTTDRNRTSPFAFTGNKFEFRAVGSGQSISFAVAIINSAVADSLNQMNAELKKLPQRDEKSVFQLLRRFIKDSKPVRFEGNNYSEEWAQEAERRGLTNLKNTPTALSVWQDEETRSFVSRLGVLTPEEIDARCHVRLEHYAKMILIEAGLLLRMVDTYVLPPCFRYQRDIASSVSALKDAANAAGLQDAVSSQSKHLARLATGIGACLAHRDALDATLTEINAIDDEKALAFACADRLIPLMEEARRACDALEAVVDSHDWPLPSYHELLFLM